jgi:hypothetical protein
MKTLIKITALALLAALAVFSCAPEAELTGVDWGVVNAQYDPGKNSDLTLMQTLLAEFDFDGSLSTGGGAANELRITFPQKSDFLKAGNDVEKRMREFLSFHHFTKTYDAATGKADTLGEALAYDYVNRQGDTITVKLTKTFAAGDSSVILKIDGTRYTFASGKKIDKIGKGRSGQAVYDDVYREVDVGGATGPDGFMAPGNHGWQLSLSDFSPPASVAAPTIAAFTIATLNLGTVNSDIYAAVAGQLQSGLKVQKYINGSWTTVDTVISYIPADKKFIGAALTFEDLVPFRAMWEGGAPVISAAEYYGVKQYIAITGTNTGYGSGNPALYQTSKVYGGYSVWYDTYEGKRFSAPAPTVFLFSKNIREQNVVLDVAFNGLPANVWVKDFTSDKQKFKDNFKIAYYSNGSGSAVDFTSRPDVVYVNIKDFEFRSYGGAAGLNGVRLTLDPAYTDGHALYFYISPEIRYTDDKTTFGDSANFMNGCFRAYEAHAPYPYPPLFAGTWEDGNIAAPGGEQWFSFIATATTQYIHFDTSGSLNDVYVRLVDSDGVMVGASQSNLYVSTPSTSRTLNPGQIYSIRVWPYSASGSGTYRIAFSDSSTAPW